MTPAVFSERRGYGAGHKERRELLLPAFSHVHVKGLVPGLWPKGVETTEKIAEVVCPSRSGAGGKEGVEVGRWYSLATLDVIGSSDFGYEFRALESAFQAGIAIPRKSSAPQVSRRIQAIGKMYPNTRISKTYN